MRYGVNYIPRKNWLHSWVDFDENTLKEDLTAIRTLGFDHIRAHLIWSYFQPNAGVMSAYCMQNLERFVSVCEEVGIDFFLSLFTGFMSGFYYFPAWIGRDCSFAMFSGVEEKKAEKFYIQNIAHVVAHSKAFLGFDLGNELSCVTGMDRNADRKTLDLWQREMFAICNACAPGKLHNNGVDHQPWFFERSFSRQGLSNAGNITPLHCWTEFTDVRNRGGLLGEASIYITDYMASLARSYADDPKRQVWIQEFGCSKLWLGEGDTIEEFSEKTLDVIADIPDCYGFTWWCSHDLQNKMIGYNLLEYDLGILDSDNKPKPYAKVISAWIQRQKSSPTVPAVRKKALVYRNDLDAWDNMERYLKIVQSGMKPTVIQPENVQNAAYLQARGIEKIVE